MPLKTLIVDDEPIARQILREELESIPAVEIVGEADNGSMALASILEHRPDLVLLDLEMPLMGGLEVVRRLPPGPHLPVVIIVTAYDSFAIQAFEAGAVDYLLKPVAQARLAQAVERARRLSHRDAAEKLAQLSRGQPRTRQSTPADVSPTPTAAGVPPTRHVRSRKVVGKVGEEYFLLNASEISAFQADGDIVWIHTAKRRYMATQTLETPGGAAGLLHRVPAHPPQRAGEPGSCPQNERAQQPTLADHAKQRSGIHRQQAPGQRGARNSEMVKPVRSSSI